MSGHFISGKECPGCHLCMALYPSSAERGRAEVIRLAKAVTDHLTDILVENGNIRVAMAFQEVHELLRRTPMDGEVFYALKDGVDALAKRASEYSLKKVDDTEVK